MTVTFLVEVDVGSDTDLISMAEDIHEAVNPVVPVLSVKHWARPSTDLLPTLGTPPQTPPDASGITR